MSSPESTSGETLSNYVKEIELAVIIALFLIFLLKDINENSNNNPNRNTNSNTITINGKDTKVW